jgi:hypothetical protein
MARSAPGLFWDSLSERVLSMRGGLTDGGWMLGWPDSVMPRLECRRCRYSLNIYVPVPRGVSDFLRCIHDHHSGVRKDGNVEADETYGKDTERDESAFVRTSSSQTSRDECRSRNGQWEKSASCCGPWTPPHGLQTRGEARAYASFRCSNRGEPEPASWSR